MEKLSTIIDRMMAKSSQLEEHVAALQKALAEIAASQAVMGELRQEKHEAYVLTPLKEINAVKKKREEERTSYENAYNMNYADITIRQNDSDVFDFPIQATNKICDAQGGSLI